MKNITLPNACVQFTCIFGKQLNDYIDAELTIISKRPIIDLFKFVEDFLPENLENEKSLEQDIIEKYGEQAYQLIHKLI